MNVTKFQEISKIVYDPKTSHQILDKLARSVDNEEILRGIAFNPNTSPETLQFLAKNENEDIRVSVAYNKSCPQSILEMLSNDEKKSVLDQIARHKNTGYKTFLKLLNKFFLHVPIAFNENAPTKILMMLIDDENEVVQDGLLKNENFPEEFKPILRAKSKRRWEAEDPTTNPKILEKLADDEFSIKLRVSENPNTPVKILERFLNEKNVEIQKNAKKQLKKLEMKKMIFGEDIPIIKFLTKPEPTKIRTVLSFIALNDKHGVLYSAINEQFDRLHENRYDSMSLGVQLEKYMKKGYLRREKKGMFIYIITEEGKKMLRELKESKKKNIS